MACNFDVENIENTWQSLIPLACLTFSHIRVSVRVCLCVFVRVPAALKCYLYTVMHASVWVSCEYFIYVEFASATWQIQIFVQLSFSYSCRQQLRRATHTHTNTYIQMCACVRVHYMRRDAFAKHKSTSILCLCNNIVALRVGLHPQQVARIQASVAARLLA